MKQYCYECGLEEVYCNKCDVKHHKDSFKEECLDYQEQTSKEGVTDEA